MFRGEDHLIFEWGGGTWLIVVLCSNCFSRSFTAWYFPLGRDRVFWDFCWCFQFLEWAYSIFMSTSFVCTIFYWVVRWFTQFLGRVSHSFGWSDDLPNFWGKLAISPSSINCYRCILPIDTRYANRSVTTPLQRGRNAEYAPLYGTLFNARHRGI